MEMFQTVYNFLENTDVKEKFEMSFIEINDDNLKGYEEAKEVIAKGYQLPITFINGEPAFSGNVDNYKIYKLVKKV